MSEVLLSERAAPAVHVITLNRPEQLNTMTAELCEAIHAELQAVARDRSCRAVVLTGAGRGFCAGVDLRGYGQAPGSDGSDAARVPATGVSGTMGDPTFNYDLNKIHVGATDGHIYTFSIGF